MKEVASTFEEQINLVTSLKQDATSLKTTHISNCYTNKFMEEVGSLD
jgi:hypothetical protein